MWVVGLQCFRLGFRCGLDVACWFGCGWFGSWLRIAGWLVGCCDWCVLGDADDIGGCLPGLVLMCLGILIVDKFWFLVTVGVVGVGWCVSVMFVSLWLLVVDCIGISVDCGCYWWVA